MKNKKLVIAFILFAVYALQLCWVKIVVVFLHILESMSGDIQNLFLCVVFVPIVEETLYRHLPLSIGKNYFGKSIIAILFGSSIVFGLGHSGGYIPNILIQGCLGFSFALIYLKLDFRYSILSHALWNLGCYLDFI
jgi:membrane protease YdiL (CAAX protease family)